MRELGGSELSPGATEIASDEDSLPIVGVARAVSFSAPDVERWIGAGGRVERHRADRQRRFGI